LLKSLKKQAQQLKLNSILIKKKREHLGRSHRDLRKNLCDSFKRGKKRPVMFKRSAWHGWSLPFYLNCSFHFRI